ncbi:unnamed protein product [Lampetra planeri]
MSPCSVCVKGPNSLRSSTPVASPARGKAREGCCVVCSASEEERECEREGEKRREERKDGKSGGGERSGSSSSLWRASAPYPRWVPQARTDGDAAGAGAALSVCSRRSLLLLLRVRGSWHAGWRQAQCTLAGGGGWGGISANIH